MIRNNNHKLKKSAIERHHVPLPQSLWNLEGGFGPGLGSGIHDWQRHILTAHKLGNVTILEICRLVLNIDDTFNTSIVLFINRKFFLHYIKVLLST